MLTISRFRERQGSHGPAVQQVGPPGFVRLASEAKARRSGRTVAPPARPGRARPPPLPLSESGSGWTETRLHTGVFGGALPQAVRSPTRGQRLPAYSATRVVRPRCLPHGPESGYRTGLPMPRPSRRANAPVAHLRTRTRGWQPKKSVCDALGRHRSSDGASRGVRELRLGGGARASPAIKTVFPAFAARSSNVQSNGRKGISCSPS